jgi:hypothetical protein
MLRLRVGAYRIMYVVEGDLITIERSIASATAETCRWRQVIAHGDSHARRA